MSKTLKHKIIAKFGNKIIDISNVPINVRKLWNRRNWSIGYFRYLKKLQLKKDLEKDLETQLNEY